jgi:hypothetical protein
MAKAKATEPVEPVAVPKAEKAEAGEGAVQQPTRAAQLRVDDSAIIAAYSNFCRVTGSPEELSIDFGFNPQPMGVPTEPIKVCQRIILNYFTAKRLLAALSLSLQRHEKAFGVIETDVNKRLRTMGTD